MTNMKSNIMPTYNRKPVSFVKGDGVYLYDNKGRKYLDALCGLAVTSLGHSNAKISETIKCGILLISHDLHVVMSATDYVVCLNGHVCCSGTPIDVAKNDHYRELFGEKSSQLLSIYEHNHDHVHSTDGDIVKDAK